MQHIDDRQLFKLPPSTLPKFYRFDRRPSRTHSLALCAALIEIIGLADAFAAPHRDDDGLKRVVYCHDTISVDSLELSLVGRFVGSNYAISIVET